MKLIIMNGPPRAGKDTFLNFLMEEGALDTGEHLTMHYCYKWTLCEEVGKRYGMTAREVWDLNANTHTKDLPDPRFGGKSVRQALIYESEEEIKKKEGETGVALRTFKYIQDKTVDYQLKDAFLFTASGGFNSETQAVIDFFGITRKDIFIVRIDREGCSFEAVGDSREYLKDPDLAFRNDNEPEDMKVFIPVIQQFLDRA